MKKIEDSRLEITKNNEKYTFGLIPEKSMIDAMKIFLADEKLQTKKENGMYEDGWFSLFRTMNKKTWQDVADGKPIPINRKQIFCLNGDFYIQDAKETAIR